MAGGKKTILWDFDGTLAISPSLWSTMLMKVLGELLPEYSADIEVIRRRLNQGYPWETPERPHPELSMPVKWWAYMEGIFADAYRLCGVPEKYLSELASEVHRRQLCIDNYTLYNDTVSTLNYLCSNGWRNVILSNHIPELPDIAERLGLSPYISLCLSSANIGYEKPHSEMYKLGLEACGYPEIVWMVGDNIEADILGAERLGIPAILVHRENPGSIKYYSKTLTDVIGIIEN